MDDDAIKAGTVISGKYRVESIIGSGGMGIVVKATQIDLERLVAIKILLDEYRDRSDAVARFFREAKVAARIKGDHVAQVIDVSKTEGGLPYIVMEYLDGEDLSSFLKREGRMPLELAVTFMLHACSAVSDAHAAHVIHRDLKPSNLFLARRPGGSPELKVLDFGISRMDDQVSHLTHTTASVGTAYYMSPEQIETPKSVDNRVDIWALGCVFHEFLVGETPFAGDAIPQIVSAVLRNARPKASLLVEGLSPAADAVIDRCLQSKPSARYANVGQLAKALAELTGLPEHVNLANEIAARHSSVMALAKTMPPEPVVNVLQEPTRALSSQDLITDPGTSAGTGAGVSVLSLSALGGVMEEDEPAPRGRAANKGPLALELDLGAPKAGGTKPSATKEAEHAPVASVAPVAKPPPPAVSPAKPPPPAVSPAKPAAALSPSTLPSAVAPSGSTSELAPESLGGQAEEDGPVQPGHKVMRFLDMGDAGSMPKIDIDPAAMKKKKDPSGPRRSPWPLRALVAFLTLIVLTLFTAIAGPRIAGYKVRSAAQAAGIQVSSDPPSISMRGWEFPNAHATFSALPGTTLHADLIRSSWTGAELSVSTVEVDSTSDLSAFERLLRSTEAVMPPSFEVIDIKFKVTPVPALTLEGTGASFTASLSPGEGRKNQFLAPRTFVKTEHATLGPFGVNLEKTSATSRARIALDPVVPDGPSIIIVRHGGVVHVGAEAHRAPLARYGIPASFVGLPEGDNPDIELTLDSQMDDRGNVSGSGTLSMWGMKVGASAPLDGSMAFHLDGTTQAAQFTTTEAKVGPFPARVHGDWSRATSSHLTLSFQSIPVPCADIARARAQKLAGVAGVSLTDLAKFTGTLSGSGQVSVAFALVMDLDVPPKVNVVYTSRDTCGLGVLAR